VGLAIDVLIESVEILNRGHQTNHSGRSYSVHIPHQAKMIFSGARPPDHLYTFSIFQLECIGFVSLDHNSRVVIELATHDGEVRH
jgi:hypothetical protein